MANFLLATTGIIKLRYSIMKKKMLLEVGTFEIIYCVTFLQLKMKY